MPSAYQGCDPVAGRPPKRLEIRTRRELGITQGDEVEDTPKHSRDLGGWLGLEGSFLGTLSLSLSPAPHISGQHTPCVTSCEWAPGGLLPQGPKLWPG